MGEQIKDMPRVSDVLLREFMLNYVGALQMNAVGREGQGHVVAESTGAQFRLRADSAGLLSCECQYREKTGLPCSHIIRALWTQGRRDYQAHIATRWIDNPQLEQPADKKVSAETAPKQLRT